MDDGWMVVNCAKNESFLICRPHTIHYYRQWPLRTKSVRRYDSTKFHFVYFFDANYFLSQMLQALFGWEITVWMCMYGCVRRTGEMVGVWWRAVQAVWDSVLLGAFVFCVLFGSDKKTSCFSWLENVGVCMQIFVAVISAALHDDNDDDDESCHLSNAQVMKIEWIFL